LKLMGGRAFRAPSVYEQVYNDGGITQARAVDEARGLSLSPESIWSGELEYAQRFGTDWVALVDGFVSRVQDIISAGPDAPGSSVIRFQNSATPVLVAGGDLELRRELRNQWMLAATYGYQRAQFFFSHEALVNAPSHLASLKAIAPLAPDLALLALRATLDAPRRVRLDAEETTGTSVLLDATLSGTLRAAGLHYVFGVYNLADQRAQVPVSATFASRTIPQFGRTVLFELSGTF
jgi:outer membrane receptor protein involved in Fe transport